MTKKYQFYEKIQTRISYYHDHH